MKDVNWQQVVVIGIYMGVIGYLAATGKPVETVGAVLLAVLPSFFRSVVK